MYVHHFASRFADWLNNSGHPGIAQARTCAAIGRHEQPVGVAVTLSDGSLWVLQTVGSSPVPGGDERRSGESKRPEPFDGDWGDRPDYQSARKQFEREQAAYDGPKTRALQASVPALLEAVVEAIRQAGHPEIETVDVNERRVLVVGCVDGAKIYGYPAGFVAPGTTEVVQW